MRNRNAKWTLLAAVMVWAALIFTCHEVNAGPYNGPHMAPPQYGGLAWDAAVQDGVTLPTYLYIYKVTGGYAAPDTIQVDAKSATTYRIADITPALGVGTYYAVATAYTATGAESGPSNEVSWTWDPRIPPNPTGLNPVQ
jgi:hypothetical protein